MRYFKILFLADVLMVAAINPAVLVLMVGFGTATILAFPLERGERRRINRGIGGRKIQNPVKESW